MHENVSPLKQYYIDPLHLVLTSRIGESIASYKLQVLNATAKLGPHFHLLKCP
jgi:hypothetical protein